VKLKSLSVAGFRGFPQQAHLDLDADAIIVAGVNGSGKTSFFDAILWALCGAVDRLGDDAAAVVSEYSPTGEARVQLVLSADDGTTATVVRRYDGAMHLSVQDDAAEPVTGPAADAMLIDLLWPDAKSAADQVAALTRSLTRATYLQQDSVRDFVDADTEQDRFQVVGELVGAGRIADLQRQLESSRNAWTRATTSLTKDVAPLETQRSTIADRLGRLRDTGETTDVSTEFRAWIEAANDALGVGGTDSLAARPIEPTAEGLDRVLRDLSAGEQSGARRLSTIQRIVAHLGSPPPADAPLEPLQAALAASEARRAEISRRLAAAQQQAAETRRLQVELTERSQSLRALGQLALQHLGDTCPVCDQAYDRDATRARLEELLEESVNADEPTSTMTDVAAVASDMEAADRALTADQTALRDARLSLQRRAEWVQTLDVLVEDVGLGPEVPTVEQATSLLGATESLIVTIRRLRSQGEQLSLRLARVAEAAQRQELEQQLVSVEAALAAQQAVIDSRNATGELATDVINALRAASSSVVTRELERIEPLLQRIFATVDPHPSFRVVSFLTRTVRGKGQLWTTLDDVSGSKNVQDPALVLSSSQLNVLAVAVFLSLNLAIPTLPLQVVALDDPLQSLDTVNLLGLADLLRRVRASRQVVVSTHDERLANLLERKLRPVTANQRTVRIDLRGWTPEGPSVAQKELPKDTVPLRLVASA
jgi:DNA repair exonuclease SbcCD ATPase subunit